MSGSGSDFSFGSNEEYKTFRQISRDREYNNLQVKEYDAIEQPKHVPKQVGSHTQELGRWDQSESRKRWKLFISIGRKAEPMVISDFFFFFLVLDL